MKKILLTCVIISFCAGCATNATTGRSKIEDNARADLFVKCIKHASPRWCSLVYN